MSATTPVLAAVDPEPFDVRAPLPTGAVVLEASAGTGKTWTLAALAARYVAEGVVELPAMLMVTFGRAATAELKDRVRSRYVGAERALAAPATARRSDDELLAHLADADDGEVARRRVRLAAAVRGFDGAVVETTHGFCRQVLAGLGVAGDVDRGAVLVEDPRDLVEEVVADLYVRKWGPPGAPAPALDVAEAREAGRAAVGEPAAALVDPGGEDDSPGRVARALAEKVREEVGRRKEVRRLLDYDDLLVRLSSALSDPALGPVVVRRLRERFRVVLVDEFQDTDPVQWDVLRRAFLEEGDGLGEPATVVLVGDPKQAVYGFRGGDVVTYLAAERAATGRATLHTDRRADEPYVAALRSVIGGLALGSPEIVVRDVQSVRAGRRLGAAASPAPAVLELRQVLRDGSPLTKTGLLTAPVARDLVTADLSRHVVDLLRSQTMLSLDGAPARPARPGDVAVLVRINRQADAVRDALAEVGVPAVVTGTASVFASPAAASWLALLRALAAPHRLPLVRAAALTPLLGWPVAELARADDAALDRLSSRLHELAALHARRGVAAVLEVLAAQEALAPRLLAVDGGERRWTDLRHVAEVLHGAEQGDGLGPRALVAWLSRRVAEAGGDDTEERARRLASDSAAVQVVTVHRSKGLEFPVVLVPFAWDRWVPEPAKQTGALRLHSASGNRLLDVSGPAAPGRRERYDEHVTDEAGEDLRLLYVALTRAQCRSVLWWAPSANATAAAVGRVLLRPDGPDGEPGHDVPAAVPPPDDDAVGALLHRWERRAPGLVSVTRVVPPVPAPRWEPLAPPPASLEVARLDREVDTTWRRTSYTALTAAAHDAGVPGGTGAEVRGAGVGSEPEEVDRDDEDLTGAAGVAARGGPSGADGPDPASVPSPMADLPGGRTFGTLVHGVLEEVDTTAVDLPAELLARCQEAVGRRLAPGVSPEALAAALAPVLSTPLGPLAGGVAFADVPRADRLTELAFELPLRGGDEPGAADRPGLLLGALGPLLRKHLAADDPLAPYADRLADEDLAGQPLRGYLTGSLDVVVRVRDAAGVPRHLVVDWKTNRLGGPDAAGVAPYAPSLLAAAVMGADYPVQALLYGVALHRFLRWRQPGYDPDAHLGGALYLFTRGMTGPDGPTQDGVPYGVFSWRPSPSLVVALSDLLDREVP